MKTQKQLKQVMFFLTALLILTVPLWAAEAPVADNPPPPPPEVAVPSDPVVAAVQYVLDHLPPENEESVGPVSPLSAANTDLDKLINHLEETGLTAVQDPNNPNTVYYKDYKDEEKKIIYTIETDPETSMTKVTGPDGVSWYYDAGAQISGPPPQPPPDVELLTGIINPDLPAPVPPPAAPTPPSPLPPVPPSGLWIDDQRTDGNGVVNYRLNLNDEIVSIWSYSVSTYGPDDPYAGLYAVRDYFPTYRVDTVRLPAGAEGCPEGSEEDCWRTIRYDGNDTASLPKYSAEFPEWEHS